MHITLIRHGETVENQNRIVQGQLPGQLTPKGKHQARQAGEELASERFDYIYCSDLRRCQQTATYIREHHPETPWECHQALREFNYGVYQGTSNAGMDWDAIKLAALEERVPRGESWADVTLRIQEFLRDAYQRHANQHLLLVTHGGPIRVIQSQLEGIPLESLLNNMLPNCGVLRYEMDSAAL